MWGGMVMGEDGGEVIEGANGGEDEGEGGKER